MAAAAELVQIEQTQFCEVIEPQVRFYDADELPELKFSRLRARQITESILNHSQQLIDENHCEYVPPPADPLGTAKKVLKAREEFGECSQEYQEKLRGLVEDCWRLLSEAYRKNTWEYFPPALKRRDLETGDYYANGHSQRQITENGLSPLIKEPEELSRRKNENIEESTYCAIGSLGLSQTVSVQTVSECTQWARKAFAMDPNQSFGGQVPEINKFMLRNVMFMRSGDRYDEQLALPGIYITHDVIVQVLNETGRLSDTSIGITELHGKQFIDVTGGEVLQLAKALDVKASDISGKNIFMGEEVPLDHPKDYDQVWQDAQERRQHLSSKAQELTEYVLRLEQEGTDWEASEVLVSHFVNNVLKKESRLDPAKAVAIYNKQTAAGYRQVAELQAAGRNYDAERLLQVVEANAPPPSYCSGGSCGLSKLEVGSEEYEKAKSLGLDTSKELLKHKDGKCKKCGEKGVVYDLKKNRACLSCERVGEYKNG